MKSVKLRLIAFAAVCSAAIAGGDDDGTTADVPQSQKRQEKETRNLQSQPLNIIVEAETDVEQEVRS